MVAIVICLVVNVYLDHLKLCGVCINGQGYVCSNECNVVSNECNEPTPALCDLSLRTLVKLWTLGVFALGVSLGLGFTNPVATRGVLDVCLGCDGVLYLYTI